MIDSDWVDRMFVRTDSAWIGTRARRRGERAPDHLLSVKVKTERVMLCYRESAPGRRVRCQPSEPLRHRRVVRAGRDQRQRGKPSLYAILSTFTIVWIQVSGDMSVSYGLYHLRNWPVFVLYGCFWPCTYRVITIPLQHSLNMTPDTWYHCPVTLYAEKCTSFDKPVSIWGKIDFFNFEMLTHFFFIEIGTYLKVNMNGRKWK